MIAEGAWMWAIMCIRPLAVPLIPGDRGVLGGWVVGRMYYISLLGCRSFVRGVRCWCVVGACI